MNFEYSNNGDKWIYPYDYEDVWLIKNQVLEMKINNKKEVKIKNILIN